MRIAACAFTTVVVGVAGSGSAQPKSPGKPTPQKIFSLVVVVNDPSGKPVAAARVSVTSGSTPTRYGLSDQAGEARFDGLPSGTTRVQVIADGFEVYGRDLLGPSTRLVVTLAKSATLSDYEPDPTEAQRR
jgi:hypothetical protein